jgi:hypothetical protein
MCRPSHNIVFWQSAAIESLIAERFLIVFDHSVDKAPKKTFARFVLPDRVTGIIYSRFNKGWRYKLR